LNHSNLFYAGDELLDDAHRRQSFVNKGVYIEINFVNYTNLVRDISRDVQKVAIFVLVFYYLAFTRRSERLI